MLTLTQLIGFGAVAEASGPIVYLLMSYGHSEEVCGYAASLAREHGLACFDPQGECLLS